MTQNANSNTGWGPLRSGTINSTEIQWFANGVNAVRVYDGGSSAIKYQWSKDEGTSWQTAVTVDSTSGNNDVMLNTNIAYDQVTGRLHFCYGRNIDAGSNPPILCHRYTDNPFNASPTFSSEHIIDAGTGYGNNRFYRVAVSAFNGHVTIHYNHESNSSFTTDGKIYRAISSDGGATWGAGTSVYSSGMVGPYEPNCCTGSDGSVFVTWYDDGVNSNSGGDLYIVISRDGGATWPSTSTKLTSTTNYGRPRPATHAGKVWIVANRPWPGTAQDVYSMSSTDNGATWGSPTLRASHTSTSPLDHPDVIVVNSFVAMTWVDPITNPAAVNFIYSVDSGANFSSAVNTLSGLTSGTTSMAPRLLATDNRIIATGYDTAGTKEVWNANPFFALLPKVGTSQIDDFSGFSNGTLLNSGNYSATAFGSAAMKANGSSGITRTSGAGTFNRSGSYRNDVTYTGNVEIAVTTTSIGVGGTTDLFIWDPSAKSGYDMNMSNGDFGSSHGLNRYATATPTVLTSDTVAGVAGEVISLQIIGNYVIGYKLVSSVWYETGGFRNFDTTYRSSLKLEIEAAGNVNAGPTIGSFYGGTVAVPSNSVAPVASGTATNGSVLSVTDGTWSNFPGRYSYQWQTSPDGSSWSSVSNATLPFFTVTDGTKQHRCQVTGTNTVGASSATNSNALAAGSSASPAAAGFRFGFR